ncbi:hypothetical protein QOT17_004076 [Balamuthia mandrillaris]
MMLKTRCTLVVLGVCALIFLAKGDQCESYSTWPTCLDDTEAKCHWCSSKNACFSVDSGEDCDNWCDTYDECKNNLCHAHQSCSSCVLDPDFYCHWCTSNDACFLEGEESCSGNELTTNSECQAEEENRLRRKLIKDVVVTVSVVGSALVLSITVLIVVIIVCVRRQRRNYTSITHSA